MRLENARLCDSVLVVGSCDPVVAYWAGVDTGGPLLICLFVILSSALVTCQGKLTRLSLPLSPKVESSRGHVPHI